MASDETGAEIMRVETVARTLDVSASTVLYWIRQGRLPAFKVGKSWRVRRADLSHVITRPHVDGDALR